MVLTDNLVEQIWKLPPENRTKLEACLYNADTPFIHALGNPNLNRTASRKSQSTLSYAFSKSNNSIASECL